MKVVKLPKELLFAKGKQFCQRKLDSQKNYKELELLRNVRKLRRSERSVQNKSILGILGVGSEEGIGRGKGKKKTIPQTNFSFFF